MSGKPLKQTKIDQAFKAGRGRQPKKPKKPKVTAVEAAARARQSERDKLRAQVGAFKTSKILHTSEIEQGRNVIDVVWPELQEEIRLHNKDCNQWQTPVLEIKHLQVVLSMSEDIFGAAHSVYCNTGGAREDLDRSEVGARPETLGGVTLCLSKSLRPNMPIGWNSSMIMLPREVPLLLIDILTDPVGEHLQAMVEVRMEWRVQFK